MGNLILGFIGGWLFAWSGTFQPELKRPPIFTGPIGRKLSWVIMLIGIYLVYLGWIRPWISN